MSSLPIMSVLSLLSFFLLYLLTVSTVVSADCGATLNGVYYNFTSLYTRATDLVYIDRNSTAIYTFHPCGYQRQVFSPPCPSDAMICQAWPTWMAFTVAEPYPSAFQWSLISLTSGVAVTQGVQLYVGDGGSGWCAFDREAYVQFMCDATATDVNALTMTQIEHPACVYTFTINTALACAPPVPPAVPSSTAAASSSALALHSSSSSAQTGRISSQTSSSQATSPASTGTTGTSGTSLSFSPSTGTTGTSGTSLPFSPSTGTTGTSGASLPFSPLPGDATPSPASSSSSSSLSTGAIVGIVIGVLAALIVCLVLLFLCLMRRTRRSDQPDPERSKYAMAAPESAVEPAERTISQVAMSEGPHRRRESSEEPGAAPPYSPSQAPAFSPSHYRVQGEGDTAETI